MCPVVTYRSVVGVTLELSPILSLHSPPGPLRDVEDRVCNSFPDLKTKYRLDDVRNLVRPLNLCKI